MTPKEQELIGKIKEIIEANKPYNAGRILKEIDELAKQEGVKKVKDLERQELVEHFRNFDLVDDYFTGESKEFYDNSEFIYTSQLFNDAVLAVKRNKAEYMSENYPDITNTLYSERTYNNLAKVYQFDKDKMLELIELEELTKPTTYSVKMETRYSDETDGFQLVLSDIKVNRPELPDHIVDLLWDDEKQEQNKYSGEDAEQIIAYLEENVGSLARNLFDSVKMAINTKPQEVLEDGHRQTVIVGDPYMLIDIYREFESGLSFQHYLKIDITKSTDDDKELQELFQPKM